MANSINDKEEMVVSWRIQLDDYFEVIKADGGNVKDKHFE